MNVPKAFLQSFFVVYVHFALQRGFRPALIAILDVPSCFVAHCFRATKETARRQRCWELHHASCTTDHKSDQQH